MLVADNLSCRRNGRTVFRDAGFILEPGGLMLVQGPNGSGKSSLLRVLAGLLPSATGKVAWEHKNISDDLILHRSRSIYVGHLDALKADLCVSEMLSYWCALRDSRAHDLMQTLRAFSLTGVIDRRVGTLSAGQRRRLSLTRLLLSPAALWLLDEPMTALDDEGQSLLHAHVATFRAQGGTIVLAAHDGGWKHAPQVYTMGATAS